MLRRRRSRAPKFAGAALAAVVAALGHQEARRFARRETEKAAAAARALAPIKAAAASPWVPEPLRAALREPKPPLLTARQALLAAALGGALGVVALSLSPERRGELTSAAREGARRAARTAKAAQRAWEGAKAWAARTQADAPERPRRDGAEARAARAQADEPEGWGGPALPAADRAREAEAAETRTRADAQAAEETARQAGVRRSAEEAEAARKRREANEAAAEQRAAALAEQRRREAEATRERLERQQREAEAEEQRAQRAAAELRKADAARARQEHQQEAARREAKQRERQRQRAAAPGSFGASRSPPQPGVPGWTQTAPGVFETAPGVYPKRTIVTGGSYAGGPSAAHPASRPWSSGVPGAYTQKWYGVPQGARRGRQPHTWVFGPGDAREGWGAGRGRPGPSAPFDATGPPGASHRPASAAPEPRRGTPTPPAPAPRAAPAHGSGSKCPYRELRGSLEENWRGAYRGLPEDTRRGLQQKSGEDFVKSIYRALTLLCHPDKGATKEEFQALQDGFDQVKKKSPAEQLRFATAVKGGS